MKTVIGYHFVKEDGTSRMGAEKPFDIGEYRRVERPDDIKLCEYGYHGCKEPADALVDRYVYGPMIEKCEFDASVKADDIKFVSAGKRVLARADVRVPLILFAADCAERVLPIFEKRYPNDKRVRECIEGVRAFARGEITRDELIKLRSAAYAAYAAAYAADYAAAYAAAYAAYAAAAAAYAAYAYAAAAYAAYAAARKSERVWQRRRFNEIMLEALGKKP
jgi:hypothetical protein